MIELAAKAAGIFLVWDCPPTDWPPMVYDGDIYHQWIPLTDDGDALRLAVKLDLIVHCDSVWQEVEAMLVTRSYEDDYVRMSEKYGNDPYAATRRAIVRAAAEIGRAMP